MKKCKFVKNPCLICYEPVSTKNGLQCKGACKRWAHYTCLDYTPGKIKDVKAGIIQVNCPCPLCETKGPKEVMTRPFKCNNQQCPGNNPPKCPSTYYDYTPLKAPKECKQTPPPCSPSPSPPSPPPRSSPPPCPQPTKMPCHPSCASSRSQEYVSSSTAVSEPQPDEKEDKLETSSDTDLVTEEYRKMIEKLEKMCGLVGRMTEELKNYKEKNR